MNWKFLLVILVCLLCASSVGFVVFRSSSQKSDDDLLMADEITMTPVSETSPVVIASPSPPPPTEAPPVTTSPPARNTDVMIYAPGNPYVQFPGGYWGPRVPIPPIPAYPRGWWPQQPRPIQPGGSFPELMGRDKDDAVAYVMSTYPNMTTVAVRYGAPLPTDYRTDRFVLVYDAYTRKIVGASIG